MGIFLTDKVVAGLPLPSSGTKRVYDAPHEKRGWCSGFGVRLSAGGTRSFVFNYRSRKTRAEHLFTIGSFPAWSVEAARERAWELKRQVQQGHDPQAEKREGSNAPTMAELCDRFLAEHVVRKRPSTQASYRHIIERRIKPTLGRKWVAAIDVRDVEKMHHEISADTPKLANRVLAVMSRMMTFAIRLKMRPDNPCKGIERNSEPSRRRYLTGDELVRLTRALAGHDDQVSANAIRLMLLSGCRTTEALIATWDQFDLDHRGIWTKPGHTTKQKRDHEAPLSSVALALLKTMRRAAPADAAFLFPGEHDRPHIISIRKTWVAACERAGIVGVRPHDTRHSFASMLVSSGASLPLIGSMLGHSTPVTTSRYSHLFDDVQREAANKVGAQLAGLIATKPKRRKLKVVR